MCLARIARKLRVNQGAIIGGGRTDLVWLGHVDLCGGFRRVWQIPQNDPLARGQLYHNIAAKTPEGAVDFVQWNTRAAVLAFVVQMPVADLPTVIPRGAPAHGIIKGERQGHHQSRWKNPQGRKVKIKRKARAQDQERTKCDAAYDQRPADKNRLGGCPA